VMNYHKPALGTFHAKYMVVDRKVALINSNNIQDRVNVEMMTQCEGEIVNAFYDMALITWNNKMTPPLPLLAHRPPSTELFNFGNDHPQTQDIDLEASRSSAIKTMGDNKFTAESAQNQQASKSKDWDVNDQAETNLDQQNYNSKQGGNKLDAITKHLNTTLQPDTKGTAPESDLDDFHPHILHAPHKPFPMAMVNRKPRGSTDYKDTDNPQYTAWLAAMLYATKSVFIQTPTFTAPAIVKATLATVRRGILVTIFADLGFNDAGEAMPKQGGTNEAVFKQMFDGLEEEHKPNLRVFWYTAKDMIRPVNASKKQRNCHVKLMVVDDVVGIQGSGNQDAQSWSHSQEANILIDSAGVCKEWLQGVHSNQNTAKYGGPLAPDGVWRDPKDGSTLEDAGNTSTGLKQMLKGVKGTIQRAQGKGGF